MTVTPSTHRGVWVEGGVVRPLKIEVTDSLLSWGQVELAGEDWPGTEDLLSDFIALSSADPEDMGLFVQKYGIPELCAAHGRPVWHEPGCHVGGGLRVHSLRSAARAISDLLDAGIRLKSHQQAEQSVDVQRLLGRGFWVGGYGREELAEELTNLYRDCGWNVLLRWPAQKPLSVVSAVPGLLGVVARLLVQTITSRSEVDYRCDVCQESIIRKRPPRPDEAIYCDRPACKREQQRRNTAAYRARKKEGQG